MQNRLVSEKRTVLVVDDNDQVRQLLAMAMEASGFAVDVASSGEAALPLLDDGHYDAVICDMLMPGMCGDDLFRVCQQRRPETARSFIFLSGSPRDLMSSDSAGATGQPYLSKPCRLADVQAAIAQVAS